MQTSSSVAEAFNKSFEETDASITERAGSTAAVAFISSKEGKKTLYTANCGDARIVLKYERANTKHNDVGAVLKLLE